MSQMIVKCSEFDAESLNSQRKSINNFIPVNSEVLVFVDSHKLEESFQPQNKL